MLISSDLTNQDIVIPKTTLDRLAPTKNKKERSHIEQRLIQAAKSTHEEAVIYSLFSEKTANFIVGAHNVRFSFDHLEPRSTNDIEIVTSFSTYDLQNENYVQQTHYAGQRLQKEKTEFEAITPHNYMKEKFEFALPSTQNTRKVLSKKRKPQPEDDRLLISLDPSLDQNSSAIRKLEEFIQTKYSPEMKRFEILTMGQPAALSSSSGAQVTSSIKPTSYTKTYRYGGN